MTKNNGHRRLGWANIDEDAYRSDWKAPLKYLDETETTLPYSSKDLMYVMDEEEAIDFIHTDGSPVKLGTAIGIDVDIGNAVELQLFSDIMFR